MFRIINSHMAITWGCKGSNADIYSLPLARANLTFKWCTLLTQTRKWRPNIGGITKSNFSARKEMSLLMPYKYYMADNNVIGAGVRRSLDGSPTSTLGVSGLIIRYS
jgi:hypothetical protein